jgi:hypothetical protein
VVGAQLASLLRGTLLGVQQEGWWREGVMAEHVGGTLWERRHGEHGGNHGGGAVAW